MDAVKKSEERVSGGLQPLCHRSALGTALAVEVSPPRPAYPSVCSFHSGVRPFRLCGHLAAKRSIGSTSWRPNYLA